MHNSRIYSLEGDPPDLTFSYLPGYPDLIPNEDDSLIGQQYYGFGITAIGDGIYSFMSVPNHAFIELGGVEVEVAGFESTELASDHEVGPDERGQVRHVDQIDRAGVEEQRGAVTAN